MHVSGWPRLVVEIREPEAGVDEALPEPFAPRREGVGVRIVREERASVELHGLRERVHRRARRRLLEGLDVDPHVLGETRHASIERRELRAGDAPQIVERAVQVVGARVEVLVGPQPIDQLFAMENPPRRQREGGQQLDGTSLPPRRRRQAGRRRPRPRRCRGERCARCWSRRATARKRVAEGRPQDLRDAADSFSAFHAARSM